MKQTPFLLKLLRGAMGTSFVVKHYRYGVVLALFPGMSRVRPTTKQRACRNLFKEAVAFARAVFADAEKKAFYRRKLGKVKHLFQALMQHYLREAKNKVEDKDNMKIKKRRQLLATGRASHYRHPFTTTTPAACLQDRHAARRPQKARQPPSRGDQHYCTTSASAL